MSKFGNPNIVGSFALDLMSWPDIDIEIEDEISEKNYWNTVQYLFKQSNLKGIFIMDYRSSINPNTPKGLYIGLQYYGRQKDPWKIDIWFIAKRKQDDENLNKWLKDNLKEEHRLPILAIKNIIASHPRYRKEIFSIDIYKAVIKKGAKNLGDFKDYLKSIGKSLE